MSSTKTAAFVCAFLTCCAPISGEVAVEVGQQVGAEYTLQTRTLPDVIDLRTGQTERVRVGKMKVPFDFLEFVSFFESSPDGLTRPFIAAGYLETLEKKLEPVALQLVEQDGVFVAQDMHSLKTVSTLVHMTDADTFARAVYGPDIFDTPNFVQIEGETEAIGVLVTDNAAFVSGADHFFTATPALSDLQAEFSPFILGHEMHHRVFYKLVIGPMVAENPKFLVDENDAHIFAGFNEGLADVFAFSFTRFEPDVIEVLAVFYDEAGREFRLPTSDFGQNATFFEVVEGPDPVRGIDCRGGGHEYCFGALLTGSLLEAVDGDTARFLDEITPGLPSALVGLRDAILETEDGGVLDIDRGIMLAGLARGYPSPLRERMCEIFQTRFLVEVVCPSS